MAHIPEKFGYDPEDYATRHDKRSAYDDWAIGNSSLGPRDKPKPPIVITLRSNHAKKIFEGSIGTPLEQILKENANRLRLGKSFVLGQDKKRYTLLDYTGYLHKVLGRYTMGEEGEAKLNALVASQVRPDELLKHLDPMIDYAVIETKKPLHYHDGKHPDNFRTIKAEVNK